MELCNASALPGDSVISSKWKSPVFLRKTGDFLWKNIVFEKTYFFHIEIHSLPEESLGFP